MGTGECHGSWILISGPLGATAAGGKTRHVRGGARVPEVGRMAAGVQLLNEEADQSFRNRPKV